jgi:hypothetical protein
MLKHQDFCLVNWWAHVQQARVTVKINSLNQITLWKQEQWFSAVLPPSRVLVSCPECESYFHFI